MKILDDLEVGFRRFYGLSISETVHVTLHEHEVIENVDEDKQNGYEVEITFPLFVGTDELLNNSGDDDDHLVPQYGVENLNLATSEPSSSRTSESSSNCNCSLLVVVMVSVWAFTVIILIVFVCYCKMKREKQQHINAEHNGFVIPVEEESLQQRDNGNAVLNNFHDYGTDSSPHTSLPALEEVVIKGRDVISSSRISPVYRNGTKTDDSTTTDD